MKKIKGKDIVFVDMSVDDIDFCNDIPQMRYENEKMVAIVNLAKARTAWIRKGVKGANDEFIKSLSEDDKNNISIAVQEHQRLGEKKPSN
jgi:hypothetical protein